MNTLGMLFLKAAAWNDSHSVGPIPRSMIIAHVRTVIWPLNSIRAVENEFTAITE